MSLAALPRNRSFLAVHLPIVATPRSSAVEGGTVLESKEIGTVPD